MEISGLPGWAWGGFSVFLLAMLALDLGVFHRRAHVVRFREAVIWSLIWIGLALLFAFGLRFFAGTALLAKFHWLIHVFGALLLLGAVKMLKGVNRQVSPDETLVVCLCRRLFPVTKDYHEDRFFVRENGRWTATPLLVVLAFVEWSDLVFAVDSIPAVLAVSRDPFIVFTSNAFAILGLRSLYFALAGLMDRFQYLHYGLAAILGFVGIKMLVMDFWPIPTLVSLGVVVGLAAGAIGLSLLPNVANSSGVRSPETP